MRNSVCVMRNYVVLKIGAAESVFSFKGNGLPRGFAHSCGAQKLLFAWSANNF